jgi:hypothetical protein
MWPTYMDTSNNRTDQGREAAVPSIKNSESGCGHDGQEQAQRPKSLCRRNRRPAFEDRLSSDGGLQHPLWPIT